MSQEINPNDSLNEFDKPKLPTSLNVLTILTIIWTCIEFCLNVYGFFTAKTSYDKLKDAIDSGKMDKMPKFIGTPEEMLSMSLKRLDNKLPLLILGLVAAALCFYGALEMRKMKKQGYTFWLAGELLPFITAAFFLGMAAFSGFGLLFVLFPLIFIILYTVNRKHLVN